MSRNVASRTKRAESNQGLKAGLGVVPGAIRVKSLEDMRSLEDRGLNDRTIEEAMSEIHQLIIDLIGGFTEIVTLDEWSWPQMSDTNIWFEDLHELFCVALGLQREKTLDHAFRRLDVDRKDLRIYLRMLVAAEISEKVFISSFPEVPVLSREWAKQAFRSLAEDKGPEYEERIAQLALRALADDAELKKKSRQMADNFSNNLLETLNPLLLSYKDPAIDREASRARKVLLAKHSRKLLNDIYVVALKLRVEMNLKNCSYGFIWPSAGDSFDKETMDAEVYGRRIDSSTINYEAEEKVAATLLPGVQRIESDEAEEKAKRSHTKSGCAITEASSLKGRVVVPALVYLKNNRNPS